MTPTPTQQAAHEPHGEPDTALAAGGVRVVQGDVREVLQTLAAGSVHCIVTSPPYWGLRDYGVEGQIGLERTPEEYVEGMVDLFRELRRVLRDDGTCWVNLGDSYCSTAPGTDGDPIHRRGLFSGVSERRAEASRKHRPNTPPGLKPKDLVGIPWRVALALQADGWYLRSDVIWSKPNPMPESVTDRPTKAHEYVFLLTKAARYFYDQEAVREANEYQEKRTERIQYNGKSEATSRFIPPHPNGRNLRTVWNIATQPYPQAHFATFPEELPRRCIRAGSPTKVCADCGAGWVRVVEENSAYREWAKTQRFYGRGGQGSAFREAKTNSATCPVKSKTLGFRPSCDCNAAEAPAVVLDPFAGSGTTGKVAIEERRDFIGIELKSEYVALARRRMSGVQVRAF